MSRSVSRSMACSLIINSSAMLWGLTLLGMETPQYSKIRCPVPHPLEHALRPSTRPLTRFLSQGACLGGLPKALPTLPVERAAIESRQGFEARPRPYPTPPGHSRYAAVTSGHYHYFPFLAFGADGCGAIE